MFQDFRLLTNKTVEQNVGFALEVIGRSRASIKQVVPEVLEMVGLEGKAKRLPHELSGGEQQRVAIARAFANRPLLLLADEPTGNLDPDTSADIMLLLERINRTGTTVLMATHDNTIVDSMRRRVIELQPRQGRSGRGPRRLRRGPLSGPTPTGDPQAQHERNSMRAGFVFSEVLTGFRRNITMTIAMILTTAISLGLLGGGLIIARLTDQMRDIYGDKVEVTIYLTPDQSALDPDCRESPCQDINEALQANADVETIEFESQAAAFERYQQQFAGQPELLEIGTPEALSASFHVKLYDPQRYRVIAEQFTGQAGRAVRGRPERVPRPAVQPAQRDPQRDDHRRADPGARRPAADLEHGAGRGVHPAHRDRRSCGWSARPAGAPSCRS